MQVCQRCGFDKDNNTVRLVSRDYALKHIEVIWAKHSADGKLSTDQLLSDLIDCGLIQCR